MLVDLAERRGAVPLQQKAQSRDPDKSNARDRENRKGGDNAKNI